MAPTRASFPSVPSSASSPPRRPSSVPRADASPISAAVRPSRLAGVSRRRRRREQPPTCHVDVKRADEPRRGRPAAHLDTHRDGIVGNGGTDDRNALASAASHPRKRHDDALAAPGVRSVDVVGALFAASAPFHVSSRKDPSPVALQLSAEAAARADRRAAPLALAQRHAARRVAPRLEGPVPAAPPAGAQPELEPEPRPAQRISGTERLGVVRGIAGPGHLRRRGGVGR